MHFNTRQLQREREREIDTNKECGDRSGGVIGDEFELHVESTKQVLILGLETGARVLV